MSDLLKGPLALTLAWAAGAGLGAIFFGGLWWTVRRGSLSRQPALWFAGSLILRMSIALWGFYLVAGQAWERWLLCLLGFFMARLLVTWLTRTAGEQQAHPVPEASHASWSR